MNTQAGLVACSMLVAGFVVLGAKLVQRYGPARILQGQTAELRSG